MRYHNLFVPEFLEAQRTSFLRLLKDGIPKELEKYNPIEITMKSSDQKKAKKHIQFQNWIKVHYKINKINKINDEYDQIKIHRNLFEKGSFWRKNVTPNHKFVNNANSIKPFIQTDQLSPIQLIKVNKNQKPIEYSQFRGHNFYLLNNRFVKLPRQKYNRFHKVYICFHANQYKLIPPTDNIKKALFHSKTYASRIYVPADLRTKSNQVLLSQWLFLGNMPLMTNRGHFIINGTPRVILHQFVRSPGVYYHRTKNKNTHYADIICQKGVWLRIELDKKGFVWFRFKNMPKIPAIDFIQAFGLEYPHLLSQLVDKYFQFEPIQNKLLKKITSKNIQKKQKRNKKQRLEKQNSISKHIKAPKNVFRFGREARFVFDLSLIDTKGVFEKYHMKKLNMALKFFKNKMADKVYDLSEIGRIQINQKFGLSQTSLTLTLDDFICIIKYLFYVQAGIVEVDDIDHLKNRRVRCSGELIQNQFGVGLLGIQRVARRERNIEDFRNLKNLKKIFNTKPIDGALKEFFNSSPLSQFMDQMNPLSEITHKRRLTSLGPGGITRETAGMKIRGIHPSHYGRICPIETPEGPNAGLVNSLTTYARINANGFLETPFQTVHEGQVQNQLFFLSGNQDAFRSIAPPDLKIQDLGFLKGQNIPVRIGNEFVRIPKKQVEFLSISRIQMISIATSLIPFLEHNDANRALMGSNMQRQSVPLVQPERAIVGTGLEGRIVGDSGHSIQAKQSGIVTYASSQKIRVLSFFKNLQQYEAGFLTYYLQQFSRSNQNTCLTHRPLVKEGEWVQKGACLVDCSSSCFGELAIGKNILVAYLPWEGYNFEDAILISERLVFDDLFTSIHIVKLKVEIKETNFGFEYITKSMIPPKQSELYDTNGIIKLGSWVTEGDILVGKLTPIGKKEMTPHQKFLYDIVEQEAPKQIDTSLRVPKDLEGRVIHIQVRQNQNMFVSGPECVLIWIAEKKYIQVGDKMAGRHGNKGIVSRILPRQDMPYLPNGTPIDMVLNPLGVPSRMNVGQIYENLLGLAGKFLNQNYKVMPFDEISGPQASRSLTFSKLYEARLKTKNEWLFQPDHPGKMFVFDGRTGEPFDQPVTVGQPYMLKLIHLVDEKIHARSTGPYALVTQQPLRGRSKRGGQRFGEMEVWALEGFGAAYTLQEILTIKSDDISGRQQVMKSLYDGTSIQIGRPESFRVLIRELQALCLTVNIFDYPIRSSSNHYRRDPMNLDSKDFNQYNL